jgi:tripeptidyl-peptidase-1
MKSTYKTVKEGDWKPPPLPPSYPGNPTAEQVCNISAVTPLCLRTLYGTVDYTPDLQARTKSASMIS